LPFPACLTLGGLRKKKKETDSHRKGLLKISPTCFNISSGYADGVVEMGKMPPVDSSRIDFLPRHCAFPDFEKGFTKKVFFFPDFLSPLKSFFHLISCRPSKTAFGKPNFWVAAPSCEPHVRGSYFGFKYHSSDSESFKKIQFEHKEKNSS
jgi:hypothetical protein